MNTPKLKDIIVEHHHNGNIWLRLIWRGGNKQLAVIKPPYTKKEVLHALDTLQILIATTDNLKLSNKNFHEEISMDVCQNR